MQCCFLAKQKGVQTSIASMCSGTSFYLIFYPSLLLKKNIFFHLGKDVKKRCCIETWRLSFGFFWSGFFFLIDTFSIIENEGNETSKMSTYQHLFKLSKLYLVKCFWTIFIGFSLAAFRRNKRKLELAEKVETDLIQLKKRRQSHEKVSSC